MNRLITTILFTLISILTLSGQESTSQENVDKVNALIKKSQNILYTNPKQASFYASKATELIGNSNTDIKGNAMLLYSNAEKLLGNFDLSINILYDILDLKPAVSEIIKGEAYAMMSIIYCTLSDYNLSIELNDKATAIFKAENDSSLLATTLNDRGIIHTYLDEYKTAEQFFKQALKINRSLKSLKKVAANLNNLCLYEGDTEEKKKYISEAIIINKNLNATWSLSENYNNLAKQYFYNKEFKKALDALAKGYEMALKIGAKELMCDNYEYSAWVYAKLKNYKKAYHYQQLLYDINRDVQNGSKLRNIEQKLAYKRYQKQQERALEKEQEYRVELIKRNFIIFSTILISMLFILMFIIKWYKKKKNVELMLAKYDLEQYEHKLTELKVRQQELTLANTKKELKDSQKEAMNFALFLRTRNELLEKIRKMIKQGYTLKGENMNVHLKKINAFIKQCQMNDNSNGSYLKNIEDKNEEFLIRLLDKHPNLTPSEKHLATLLRANLGTKDISILTGNIPKTINMQRYRLRKSLSLATDEDLVEYLQGI